MIAVFPFNSTSPRGGSSDNCYGAGPLTLYYNSDQDALCFGEYTSANVYLDGPDLANSTSIFADASCNCAIPGFYMDPNDTTRWYFLNGECVLSSGICGGDPGEDPVEDPVEDPGDTGTSGGGSPSPTPSTCDSATNLTVNNEYTVDYVYPSSLSSTPIGGGGGAIGG